MSTIESPDRFSSSTSWRARVRFVRDLAPRGLDVFMAPERSMRLRLCDSLYTRTPMVLTVVALAWGAAALSLWPAVSSLGFAVWTLLVGGAFGYVALLWHRTERPMLRPGASSSWEYEHVSALWLLFLAFASAAVLLWPAGSLAHLQALSLIVSGAGILAGLLVATSIRALAAVLGPTIGLVALLLIYRGATPLAAAVSLSGGIAVLAGMGLHQLAADHARRDVESG